MKKTFYTGVCLLIATFFILSCDKDEDTGPVYPTMDSYLGTASDLTVFKAALDKAQLQAFKDGPGPFTWIAPNDAAFQARGITTSTINSLSQGEVNYLLQYHLINALVTTTDMTAQNSFPRATQLSSTTNVYIGQLNNDFYINGSKLISTDNRVSNGVVHVSSRVNIPPNLVGNIQGILNASGQHSLFIAALMRAGRWATLSSASVYTVFAPNDAAMTAAGYTTASINAATVGAMDSVVRYHMFSGTRLFTNDIGNRTSPGTFLANTKTLLGSNNGTKIKGLGNAAPVDIVIPDILGINGIVHIINGVLRY